MARRALLEVGTPSPCAALIMNTCSGLSRAVRSAESPSSSLFFTRSILLNAMNRGCWRRRASEIRSTSGFIPAAESITSRIRSASWAPVQAAATIARSSRRRGSKMPGVSTSRICVDLDRDAHQPRTRGLRLGADDRDLLADQRIDQSRLPAFGAPMTATKPALVSRLRSLQLRDNKRFGRGGFGLLLAGAFGRRFAEARRPRPDRELGRVVRAGARHDFIVGRLAARGRGQLLERRLGMVRRLALLGEVRLPSSRMKRSAASNPPSSSSAPISASTTSPTTFSLWLAPSSRACFPSRTSVGTPSSRPISAQVSRATSTL